MGSHQLLIHEDIEDNEDMDDFCNSGVSIDDSVEEAEDNDKTPQIRQFYPPEFQSKPTVNPIVRVGRSWQTHFYVNWL